MDAHALEMLIPLTAILAVFGCPVALLFVFKWFKLRDRELQLEAEMRKDLGAAMESRVQRLESILLQIEPHLRPQVMQGPPDLRVSEQAGGPLPLLRSDRNG
jgi:hypothetical protein